MSRVTLPIRFAIFHLTLKLTHEHLRKEKLNTLVIDAAMALPSSVRQLEGEREGGGRVMHHSNDCLSRIIGSIIFLKGLLQILKRSPGVPEAPFLAASGVSINTFKSFRFQCFPSWH